MTKTVYIYAHTHTHKLTQNIYFTRSVLHQLNLFKHNTGVFD